MKFRALAQKFADGHHRRHEMFAVYAKEANLSNPLASVVVGERPEPIVPEGWVRIRVTHASLNRHDIFTAATCRCPARRKSAPPVLRRFCLLPVVTRPPSLVNRI